MSEAKTEEPTPRRERRAREEGRAWQSRDLTLGAVLVALGGLIHLGAPTLVAQLAEAFTRSLRMAASPAPLAPRAMLDESFATLATVALPVLVAIVVVGTAASALQVRGLFALGVISPDASRLDPSARFSGTAGLRTASSLALSLARLGLLLAVAIGTLAQGLPGIATLSRQPPASALEAALTMASALAWRSGLGLLGLGVLDAVVERVLFRLSLRMSRREVERERREVEGDAHVRRERERARDELARAGTLDDVRHAALLVIEPGALAVALAYDASDPDDVPRVLAVGREGHDDDMAREARAHGVRVASEAELAAQLAIVAVGTTIPESLYEPVARAMQRGTAAP